jgi:hypothetical protein
MTAYLYPNLKSKKAFKEAVAAGKDVGARELTPFGSEVVTNGTVVFSGPHYPEPHKFYGKATVVDGKVTKIV